MSTQDVFDPYRKWLGIPPADQPPNHYRLLGIGLFEDDADTISIAADRQMAHVRTFQTGPHSALSQKLLNELAAARISLLDPKKKAAYDQQLRAKVGPSLPASGGAGEGTGVPPAKPVSVPPSPPKSTPPRAAPLAAGQGRGGVTALTSSAVIVADDTEFGASSAPRLRRKRSRQAPAVWLGLAAAAAAIAAVVYVLHDQRQLESHPKTVTSKRATDEPVKPVAPERKGESAGQRRSPPQQRDELASRLDRPEPEADTAPRGGRAKPPEPTNLHADNNPPATTPSAPPASSETSPIEKPRSMADLTKITDRPQLDRTRREAPPDGKSQSAAATRFTQQYGKEISAAKTADARKRVELKIWNEARDGTQAADLRFAMLDSIAKEEVSQGNVGAAYRVANEVARQFDVEPFAIKLKALDAAGKTALTPEAFGIGVLQALALVDRAAAEGKLDVANKAAGQAGIFARKTKEKELISQTDRRKAGLREQSEHLARYKKAQTELKKSSADQDANLTAGKYEMLLLGDWRGALPKLAASGNERLAEVARLEAEARLDPGQWAPLAAAWWQAAQEETDDYYKPLCQQQAKFCHLRAVKSGRAGGLPTDVIEQIKNVPGYPLSRLVPGTAARYYDGGDFQKQHAERAESSIDFYFGQGWPDPSVQANFFSIRWTGFFKPPVSGRYRLVTFTDDSVRLWVDGKQVLNRWGQNAQWQQVELELSDDLHTFLFEYNDTFDVAFAQLGWSLADFSDAKHVQWSPIDALYYDPEIPFDVPDLP
jgi:hypothetical protein